MFSLIDLRVSLVTLLDGDDLRRFEAERILDVDADFLVQIIFQNRFHQSQPRVSTAYHSQPRKPWEPNPGGTPGSDHNNPTITL